MLSNTQAAAAAASSLEPTPVATHGSFIPTLHGRVWPLLVTHKSQYSQPSAAATPDEY